jgi:DNA-binding CsgD family transcriptional regulator
MGTALAGIGRMAFYTEDRVAAISAKMAMAIDAATFGSGNWDQVPLLLSSEFPGSFSALWNLNFAENRHNFVSFRNIDPAFERSYNDHFAYINPWTSYWPSVKSGTAVLSEEACPARSFAATEFYNDWLLPQKDVEAAVGMKLAGEHSETVQLIMHFPVSQSDSYGRAAAEILTRISGNLGRHIKFARLMRQGVEGAVAGAALVERSRCAAFVVESNRLVREANDQAVELFSSGQALQVRNGRCSLNDRDADTRFASALRELSANLPVSGTHISFRTAAGAWQVTMAALPATSGPLPNALTLFPPQKMVLVLVADLRPRFPPTDSLTVLSKQFGLTPAEISFCRRLALGESVAEASGNLNITVETARTRLKAILHKTGVSRQSQLMLLFSRLN